MLHPLRLVRPRDAQADGREEQAAQRDREQELLRMRPLDAESAQHGARDRRVVEEQSRAARAVAHARDLGRKDARAGVQERATLRAARAVRDTADQEGVRASVEAGQGGGIRVHRRRERQGAVSCLPERVAHEPPQVGGRPDLSLLRGGLQPARMREAAGGQRRIRELKQQPGELHERL